MTRSASSSSIRQFKRTRRAGAPLGSVAIVFVFMASIWAGFQAATQFAADRFQYDPRLGAPLAGSGSMPPGTLQFACAAFVAVAILGIVNRKFRDPLPFMLLGAIGTYAASRGPFYHPLAIVKWSKAFGTIGSAAPVLEQAQYVGFAFCGVMLVAAMFTLGRGEQKDASNAHGTAEFGTGDEFVESKKEAARHRVARAQGYPVNQGILVGRHRSGAPMWYKGDSHALVQAPTRSGKGVGLVIPNLLLYTGSMVITDVKGENYAVTNRRRAALGQTVLPLDPFGVVGDTAVTESYNPLDFIDVVGDRRMFATDDAMRLASVLILDAGPGGERHWVEAARSVLVGFMLYVKIRNAMFIGPGVAPPADLLEVRRLITLPENEFLRVLDDMSTMPHEKVQRTAASILQKDPRERSGVISTVQSNTDFLDTEAMATVLRESTFDLSRLKTDKLSIYLIIPPPYLKSHAAWLRVMIVAALQVLTASQDPPPERVLFMLDEFANLGYMQAVVEGISLVGGYGATFVLLVQDLPQVKGVYEKNWGTLHANCDVKVMFGTNDITTAEELSKYTGDATVFTEGGNSSVGRSLGRQTSSTLNAGESVSEKGRKLLLPDEVLRMTKDEELLLIKGSKPMIVRRVRYYEDPEFLLEDGEPMFAPNPMYSAA